MKTILVVMLLQMHEPLVIVHEFVGDNSWDKCTAAANVLRYDDRVITRCVRADNG